MSNLLTGVNWLDRFFGAITLTSADFIQPSANATVMVPVDRVASIIAGQAVFVQGGGYYTVTSVASDATSVVLTNLGISGNASPSATIPNGSPIGPAGPQGSASTGRTVATKTSSFTVLPSDNDFSVAVSTAALEATLPDPTGGNPPTLWESHGFKDSALKFATHSFTIAGAGGAEVEQPDGTLAASLVLRSNGASVSVRWNGTFWEIV